MFDGDGLGFIEQGGSWATTLKAREAMDRFRGDKAWGCLAALAVVLVGESFARADGVVRDSLGAVSGGRGGTNVAHDDNLALIHDNPAGLARLDGLRLDLGADLLQLAIDYEDPRNDVEAKDETFVLPLAGASWRAMEGPLPLTVGLGVFVPAGFGAEYEIRHDVFGREEYVSRSQLLKLLACGAVDLGGEFSLGASVGAAHESTEIESPYTFQTGALKGAPARIDLEADGFGLAWNVGLQYRPTPRWTLGIAYLAETTIPLAGDFEIDLTGVLPLPDATARYKVDLQKTWPRSLGAGTSYRFDRVAASLDLLWFDWSAAFDNLTVHLRQGDNPTFDALAGSAPSDRFPLEWRDSFSLRVGAEVFVTGNDTLRAGYIYRTNPVPDSTLTPLLPATLEHGFTLGYGRRIGPASVDLAYEISFGFRNRVEESEIVGGDFDDSSSLVQAHTVFLGVSLRLGTKGR